MKNMDELLSYERAAEEYGYKAGTMKQYIYMGYLMGIDDRIPRYEMERYIIERRKKGAPPKTDWNAIRDRIHEVATALSGDRPGWFYNKASYVLIAAQVLGHSPLWISKVLQRPLNEVKEICQNLHLSGTWKGAYSMHTEWSDVLDDLEKRDRKEMFLVQVGFQLDCLVGKGAIERLNKKYRICMSCGGRNLINSWLCQGCSKPFLDVVVLKHEGPNTDYHKVYTLPATKDWAPELYQYPPDGSQAYFAIKGHAAKNGINETELERPEHFSETQRWEIERWLVPGEEKASPGVYVPIG